MLKCPTCGVSGGEGEVVEAECLQCEHERMVKAIEEMQSQTPAEQAKTIEKIRKESKPWFSS